MFHEILTISTFWSMHKAEKKDILNIQFTSCGSFTISTFRSMYKAEKKDILKYTIYK